MDRVRWIAMGLGMGAVLAMTVGRAAAIEIENTYVGVSVEPSMGDFTCGGTATTGSVRLNYGWPAAGSTSWTHFWVDSTVYSNVGMGSVTTTDGVIADTLPPESLSTLEAATGSNVELRGTYGFLGGVVTCEQVLRPVPLVSGTETTGTIQIMYIWHNLDTTTHCLGTLLQLDMQVNNDDAAPISSDCGFSASTEVLFDPLTSSCFPTAWYAWGDAAGPSSPPGTVVAGGMLRDFRASVPPDQLLIGAWPTYVGVNWDYTPTFGPYTDSSVLMRWGVRCLAPGDSFVWTGYFGFMPRPGLCTFDVSAMNVVVPNDGPCGAVAESAQVVATITNTASVAEDNARFTLSVDSTVHISGDSVITLSTMSAGMVFTATWWVHPPANTGTTLRSYNARISATATGLDSACATSLTLGVPPGGVTPAGGLVMNYPSAPDAGGAPIVTHCSGQIARWRTFPPTPDLAVVAATITVNGVMLVSGTPFAGDSLTVSGAEITFWRGDHGAPVETLLIAVTNVTTFGGCTVTLPPVATLIVDHQPPNIADIDPPPGTILPGPNRGRIRFRMYDDIIGAVTDVNMWRDGRPYALAPAVGDTFTMNDGTTRYAPGETLFCRVRGTDNLANDSCAGIPLDTTWYYVFANTGVGDAAHLARPTQLTLAAHPNPFNPRTTFTYTLPSDGPVRLDVVDALGAHVRTLVEATQSSGAHAVEWDAHSDAGAPLPTGVYFARMAVGGQTLTRRVMLLK